MMPVASVTIGVGEGVPPEGTHTVTGYALTFPLPPGPVKAEVTVDTATYETPFKEEVPAGPRVFKATWMEQTLEQEVDVNRELTILFLFDPVKLLSRAIVLPPLPPLPTLPTLPTE